MNWRVSGHDFEDFEIADGRLVFGSAPDFEQPAGFFDDGNTYEVTVEAFDGDLTGSAAVRVMVANLDEPGEVLLSSVQPQAETPFQASVIDPDRIVGSVAWVWERSADRSSWTAISGAASDAYTPRAVDVGMWLRVTASYGDGHGSPKSASAVSGAAVREEQRSNSRPTFGATGTVQREVDENTPAGRSIGTPVAATDPDDGDHLTYALGGAHAASFDLDARTGQLLTKATLNHEDRGSFSVQVTVTDTGGESATQPVTVTVKDVDETPTVLGDATPSHPSRSTAAVATYRADDPEDRPVQWALSGPDPEAFTIDSRGTLRFTHPPDIADPATADAYEVTVEASDGNSTGHLDVTVTITGVVTVTGVTGQISAAQVGGTPAVKEPQAGASEQEPAQMAADRFEEVDTDDYFAAAVGWMVEHDITTGCSKQRFCPGADVKRAQFVTFLWRAAGKPVPARPGSAVFSDVAEGAYYDAAVGWASETGVTAGCRTASDESMAAFCPDRAVNRAQAATLLHRAVGSPEPAQPSRFDDVEPGAYYEAAVSWMAQYQIAAGYTPTEFRPTRNASRAQAATFIYRTATTPQSWASPQSLFSTTNTDT